MTPNPPSYEYLLGVGPGRSGSTFLHAVLTSHGAFEAPEIKESLYYRSSRRFEKALRRVRGAVPSAILVDVANHAYRDPSLAAGIETLEARGHRALLVVLFREHRARAASMMRFRKSRGELSALFGEKVLERTVVRDSLAPGDLSRLYGLPVDVLTVEFSALVEHTERVLKVVADLCGTAEFGPVPRCPVNESVRARSILLSAIGKLAALALRKAGFRRTLHRTKEHPRVRSVFFVPFAGSPGEVRFSDWAESLLQGRYEACRRVIGDSSTCLGEGIWLKRGDAGGG